MKKGIWAVKKQLGIGLFILFFSAANVFAAEWLSTQIPSSIVTEGAGHQETLMDKLIERLNVQKTHTEVVYSPDGTKQAVWQYRAGQLENIKVYYPTGELKRKTYFPSEDREIVEFHTIEGEERVVREYKLVDGQRQLLRKSYFDLRFDKQLEVRAYYSIQGHEERVELYHEDKFLLAEFLTDKGEVA